MKPLRLLLSLFVLLSGNVFAQTLNENEAREIAEKFVQINFNVLEKSMISDVRLMDEQAVYYTFRYASGFVIVSAEEQYEPVLAYSNQNSLPADVADYPPAMKSWLDNLAADIQYVRNHNISATPRAIENRQRILSNQSFAQTRSVAPLLSTTWNQGCGYNADCPVDGAGPCGHVYTGCVATAQAQAMKYHAHPATGNDSHCYTHSDYGELCADFGAATYDWASMPNNSGNADVAQLMSHCGISVNMNYSPTGSGAYTSNVASSLIDYFDYTTNLKYVGRYSFDNDDWEDLMRKECDAGKVMVYKGTGSGGHAFVLDGYGLAGAFHFNWGWGGTANGYFMMDNLTPSGQDYSNSNYAIVGMEPSADFPGLDFSGISTLSCGATTSVDLSTGVSVVNKYGNAYVSAYGKERTFEFTTTMPGRITINIDNNIDDISVILLSHQHQDSVIAYGTNSLIVDNTLAGTYYLVLDVAKAQDATCDVTVLCPTIDADLIITQANIIPESIESGQTNVLFRSTLKNIGNSDAGVTEIEYYLSDDNELSTFDHLLATTAAPALTVGEEQIVESYHTMPLLPAPGSYYIIAVPDAQDAVVETVEDDVYATYASIPDPGVMDCTSSISLTDGVWHWDNTAVSGDSIIDQYWCGWNMTGNEMIFSFTPINSGMANVWLSEKLPGSELQAILLPICNENANCVGSVAIWDMMDTVYNEMYPVVGGVEYYLIVDGQNDLDGEFGVKVDMPAACPDDTIMYWGSTDLCEGDFPIGLQTNWGYSSYQWFMDGNPIPGETTAYHSADETGEYYLEITENGCTIESQHVQVTFSPAPDTAHIIANTSTDVCFGNTAELEVDAGYTYDIQWYLDGVAIPGATNAVYLADQTGEYYADVINVSCHLTSNSIQVNVSPEIVDFGESIPPSEISALYHFPLDDDNLDAIGNYGISTWSLLPVDDRDGNFWFAREFAAATDFTYMTTQLTDPNEFTHALWFKTSDTDGGILLQFDDSPWGVGTPDRTLYMSDDGKLHFYLGNSGSPVEITSANAYNDGNWHHVVVSAGTYAHMRIDDGLEDEMDVTVLSLDAMTGYWVYGGSEIPSGLSDPPTDPYLQASIDDLRYFERVLPWMETTYFLNDFDLEAELRFDTVCDMGDVYLDFNASQPGILYHVRNVDTGDTIPGSVLGTGSAVFAGPLGISSAGTYNYEVVAVDTATACSQLLSETFQFVVLPSQVPEVSMLVSPNDSVCSGTEITITPQVVLAGGDNPEFEWVLNGINQGIAADYTLSSAADADSLVLIMHSDYACATTATDTVDQVFTVHAIPNPSFIYPAGVCEGDSLSVTYTGTTTDVASISWDVNGILQLQTGDGTHQFASTSGITNIGCEVETIYGCTSYFVVPIITYDAPESNLPDTTWYCDNATQITLDAGALADEYYWSGGASTSQTYDLYPFEDAIYVTLTNTLGSCTLIDSTQLVPYADHLFTFPEAPDTTVCIEDGFSYEIPAEFTNVEWAIESSVLYGNSVNYAYAGNDSIGVAVYYTNMYGCEFTADLILKFEVCTGISNDKLSDFAIYPNPSNGLFYVELPMISQNAEISVHDITGKEIMKVIPESLIIQLDLSDFSDGFYLVKYKAGETLITKRLDLIR